MFHGSWMTRLELIITSNFGFMCGPFPGCICLFITNDCASDLGHTEYLQFSLDCTSRCFFVSPPLTRFVCWSCAGSVGPCWHCKRPIRTRHLWTRLARTWRARASLRPLSITSGYGQSYSFWLKFRQQSIMQLINFIPLMMSWLWTVWAKMVCK